MISRDGARQLHERSSLNCRWSRISTRPCPLPCLPAGLIVVPIFHRLSKKINKKVMSMFEKAEQEFQDLKERKTIIENDKSKIEKVIAELDAKKNETLKKTWAKVNRDFGSIFSTLLPGANAKLEPEEGKTVLDGLCVRVALGEVWKESLTELSGGQR